MSENELVRLAAGGVELLAQEDPSLFRLLEYERQMRATSSCWDNMLTAHARNPFVGPRKIIVTLGEMMHC